MYTLSCSCHHRALDTIRLLLDGVRAVCQQSNSKSNSVSAPLFEAVIVDGLQFLKMPIESGADVEDRQHPRKSTLEAAISYGQTVRLNL